jgi:hypothetical protein
MRSQDITQGLLNVDQTSVPVVRLRATRLTGWSASLAANLRDQEIEDLDALREVAAAQLGVEGFAFDAVVRNLEETELASRQRRRDKEILYVAKIAFPMMYERLGDQWQQSAPTEFDQAIVSAVDGLATAPAHESVLGNRLGVDADTLRAVVDLGEDCQLIKSIGAEGADRLLYTPFQAFERLDALPEVFRNSGDDELAAGFSAIRAYQGLPLKRATSAIQAAVKQGLLLAPTVNGIAGEHAFIVVPYRISGEPDEGQKLLLDKALAILAAVRYGENYGQNYKIKWPELVLRKLADETRDHQLNPHPELGRQYQVLAKMGIVRLVPSAGGMYAVRLIATEDNKRALAIAIDLVEHGELVGERQPAQSEFDALLRLPRDYRSTLWTMKHAKVSARIPEKLFTKLLIRAQGGAPLGR